MIHSWAAGCLDLGHSKLRNLQARSRIRSPFEFADARHEGTHQLAEGVARSNDKRHGPGVTTTNGRHWIGHGFVPHPKSRTLRCLHASLLG